MPAQREQRHASIDSGAPALKSRLELWGGVESTLNRVADSYMEQLERSGHALRISDLDSFADLGIAALRQPVLWELTAPRSLHDPHWEWSDRWLQRLRELGIRPIAGLLHHGSGPRYTNLLDDAFPQKLASYARSVARRYPWLRDYTPVNEPMTTARFSALYGHWYPHARDDRSFLRALLNQCKGIVLAMRAVREINPDARLIQTDDLGKVFSTPALSYQADFENERRWLSFDLLCGRVGKEHALWKYLLHAGLREQDLEWFADPSTAPDVLGFNYYVTSERYLDDAIGRYPSHLHGGNGRHRYADVEAARVRREGIAGPGRLLREAWERYSLPMAITECHNGCTREEQLRWFVEVWSQAEQLRSENVDLRAVTAWSLLGAFDWASLVTKKLNRYEPGIFDIRAPEPRATALVPLLRTLARGGRVSHPLLAIPGWWHRPERLCHGMSIGDDGDRFVAVARRSEVPKSARPILVTAGDGPLGAAFGQACTTRAIPWRLLRHGESATSSFRLAALFDRINPWAVIHAAGEPETTGSEESTASPTIGSMLAAECARRNLPFVGLSSQFVFRPAAQQVRLESDSPDPILAKGRADLLAETEILRKHPGALLIRTGELLDPGDSRSFVYRMLAAVLSDKGFPAANDSLVSLTFVPDLVDVALDLMIDGESGVWHLTNPEPLSWNDLASMAVLAAGLDDGKVIACTRAELERDNPQQWSTALGTERGWLMPSVEEVMLYYTERLLADGSRPAMEPAA